MAVDHEIVDAHLNVAQLNLAEIPQYPTPPPVVLNPQGVPTFDVEAILDVRFSNNRRGRGKKKRSFLIKWSGFDRNHNSWILENDLANFAPRMLAAFDATP